MLAVSDNERDAWQQLVDDTEGRLAVMLTTPTHLVVATDLERVLNSPLLPTATAEGGGEAGMLAAVVAVNASNAQQQQQQQQQEEPGDVQQDGMQQVHEGQQQQQQQGGAGQAAAAAAGADASAMNGRFIHIDA
jgi:hypothetical protein